MYRTLIKNATVIDGTGGKPLHSDILIDGETIIETGKIHENIDVNEKIDADGLILSPGFIDAHTHAELSLLNNRQQPGAVTQGITTMIMGLCGLGLAPLKDSERENTLKFNTGIFGQCLPYKCEWKSFGEFLQQYEGCAPNVGSAVTYNAIRVNTLGFEDVHPSSKQIDQMVDDVKTAMEQGAVGLSVGLTYYPQAYSMPCEVEALCRAVKEYNGLFMVHMRNFYDQILWDPSQEIIDIVKNTGVRTHMLHYRTGSTNAGKTEEMLRPFMQLIEQGYDISFEFYPYFTGAGHVLTYLPGWVQEGGYFDTIRRLKEPALRGKIIDGMLKRYQVITPDDAGTFTHLKNRTEYLGKDFRTVARIRKQNVPEMLIEVLIENDLEVGFKGIEETDPEIGKMLFDDMMHLIDFDFYTIGSDSIPAGRCCHPRTFGTFPRLIKMVRENRYPIEKFIHKITQFSSSRFGLTDRGLIRKGMKADLVLFNYEKVKDNATFEHPRRSSSGFQYVFVNGEIVVENERVTGLTPGSIVKPWGQRS